MKWIMSEPVKWLESFYDSLTWDCIDKWETPEDASGWITTGVLETLPDGRYQSVTRMYSAPMIRIKESSEAGPSEDVSAASRGLNCTLCGSGQSHRCEVCESQIDHMTGNLCPGCWSRPDGEDDTSAG